MMPRRYGNLEIDCVEERLTDKLFGLFTGTLNSKCVIVREGPMVVASFVDVPKQRNNREFNSIIHKGAVTIRLVITKIY
jgi:hypothetical protein|tara:strand:+ start:352 stop:588 length:237 start_codon:yes stop_codon:yes gene_type:complete